MNSHERWWIKVCLIGLPIYMLAVFVLFLSGCTSQPTKTNPGVIVEPVTVNRVQYVPIPDELTEHGEVYVRKDDTVGEYIVSSERNTAIATECVKQLESISQIQGSEHE